MINIIVQAQLDPQAAVLRFLRENQNNIGYNIEQVSVALHISRPTTSKYCSKLLSNNQIVLRNIGTNKVYAYV